MLNSYKLLAVCVVTLVVFVGFLASPVDVEYHFNRLTNKYKNNTGPVADGIPLRIMCLGASMTRGEKSTGTRGYRKQLRDKLTSLGNPVNLVGFNRAGDWEDNDVEAYNSQKIKQIHEHAIQAVPPLQPNLVLINAGSNDCFQKDDPLNAMHRMRALVDYILEASPRVTVIMSTLLLTTKPDSEPCMESVNAQIRQVAYDLMREKKPVALGEMHWNQGLPNRIMPSDMTEDKMHPKDEGYSKMGDIFMEKIREVEEKGFLQAPIENGIADDGETSRKAEEHAREKAQKEHPINPKNRKRRYNNI